MAILRSRHGLRSVRDLDAYLFTVLRRTAMGWIARRRREPAPILENGHGSQTAAAAEPTTTDPRTERLERARGGLLPDARAMANLRVGASRVRGW